MESVIECGVCHGVCHGVSQSYLRAVSELSQSYLRAVSELSQSYLRAVSELSQSCLRAVSELSQSCLNCWRWSCLRAVSELSQSCLRAVSELSQSCLRAVAECLRAVPERNMECHIVSQSQDGVSRSVTMERSGVCDHRLISPTRQNPGSCCTYILTIPFLIPVRRGVIDGSKSAHGHRPPMHGRHFCPPTFVHHHSFTSLSLTLPTTTWCNNTPHRPPLSAPSYSTLLFPSSPASITTTMRSSSSAVVASADDDAMVRQL
jgi:hypothetical protein